MEPRAPVFPGRGVPKAPTQGHARHHGAQSREDVSEPWQPQRVERLGTCVSHVGMAVVWMLVTSSQMALVWSGGVLKIPEAKVRLSLTCIIYSEKLCAV